MDQDPVNDLIAQIFAPPTNPRLEAVAFSAITDRQSSTWRHAIRHALLDMHIQNLAHPIRFPSDYGAFPGTLLTTVPLVQLDAAILHDDILYACRSNQRTVLVNAANAGLIRLLCAQHVVNEVTEHSLEWTTGTPVSQSVFLDRWLLEYLPLFRVLQDTDVPASLLTPEEALRIAKLRGQDHTDVPSATSALVLGAFYLTADIRALEAVYGPDVDLAMHHQWLDVLKAGGDAGELGQMFQLAARVAIALGNAAFTGGKRLVDRWGWISLLPFALGGVVLYKRMRPETRSKFGSGVMTTLMVIAEIHALHREVLQRFQRAAPAIPSWDAMAETNDDEAVLARCCLYVLARCGASNCSARDLRSLIPHLVVPHGEAKIRHVLRNYSCFSETWLGRWQVGRVAEPLRRALTGPTGELPIGSEDVA